MKHFFRIASCLAVCLFAADSRAGDLPARVMQIMPANHEVLTYSQADLDGDGTADYVVVLKSKLEETRLARDAPAPRRPLLVIMQTGANVFRILERNDEVVIAADGGGQCDPFRDGSKGLVVKKSYFTVQNGVACGQHWTDYYTFRYSKELRRVVFHNNIFEEWVWNPDPKPGNDSLVLGAHKVTKADQKKPVTLTDFAPFPADEQKWHDSTAPR